MNTIVLLEKSKDYEMSTPTWYVIGGILAVFILAYLIYSLIKPEKF